MIQVVGSVVVREDGLTEALTLSLEHVRRSRSEPGCMAHAVHRDVENPLRLVFVESWATREALWDHFKVPASQGFAKALATLAQAAPEIAVYDAVAVALPGKP